MLSEFPLDTLQDMTKVKYSMENAVVFGRTLCHCDLGFSVVETYRCIARIIDKD